MSRLLDDKTIKIDNMMFRLHKGIETGSMHRLYGDEIKIVDKYRSYCDEIKTGSTIELKDDKI